MTEENVFYVYEHWRPDKNVCFYVGKGKGKRAWSLVRVRNRWHTGVVSKLTSIGLTVDVRIIASNLSAQDALAMEIERIAMYGRGNLTNLTRGGDGLVDPSPEVVRRISESQKARYAKMTPEERAKFFECFKNRPPISEETRKKLSLSSTGRCHDANARERISTARKAAGMPRHVIEASIRAKTGKKLAPFKDSTIEKMRLASIERERRKKEKRLADCLPHLTVKSRSVVCLDDGKIFPSIAVASEYYGIHRTTINQVCKGVRSHKTAGGKRFAYEEEREIRLNAPFQLRSPITEEARRNISEAAKLGWLKRKKAA